jgi:hypothetical protein
MRRHGLALLVLIYMAASVFHHVHNAELLDEYPNLPRWITPGLVYALWSAITGLGVLGYLLLRSRRELIGLALLAVYGAAGLYGLVHYGFAPLAAHSTAMNLGIWLEAASGLLLLSVAAALMRRSFSK